MKVNFENSSAPYSGFEPRTFRQQTGDLNHQTTHLPYIITFDGVINISQTAVSFFFVAFHFCLYTSAMILKQVLSFDLVDIILVLFA